MPETNLGPYTVKSHGSKLAGAHFQDWMILLILAAIEGLLNYIEPFHRYVGKDMMTNLMYPFHKDSIPMWAVPILCILVPIAVFIIFYIKRRDVYDLHHAILGLFYACLITGVITDSIKDAVGRPRPNFYMRCFPTGKAVFNTLGDVMCYGDKKIIKEGYKSFPSGHTSWSFAGLGFLAWYLSGKIRVFDRRGHVAKLCLVLLPLLAAAFVGITRVDDYWHHWTDVFAGGLIGLTVSSIVYLILFPFPALADGWAPHAYFQLIREEDASSEAGDFQMQQAGTRPAHVASSDSPGMDAMERGTKF